MLAQILYARKHEVLMSIHEKSDAWGSSTHAKLAAEIHKDYVSLLNTFCKIQDKHGIDGWEAERDEQHRISRGMSLEEWRAYKDAGPPSGGPGLEMTAAAVGGPGPGLAAAYGRADSGFEVGNPMLAGKGGGGAGPPSEADSSGDETDDDDKPPPPAGAPPPLPRTAKGEGAVKKGRTKSWFDQFRKP